MQLGDHYSPTAQKHDPSRSSERLETNFGKATHTDTSWPSGEPHAALVASTKNLGSATVKTIPEEMALAETIVKASISELHPADKSN